jgi:hypothetical protein
LAGLCKKPSDQPLPPDDDNFDSDFHFVQLESDTDDDSSTRGSSPFPSAYLLETSSDDCAHELPTSNSRRRDSTTKEGKPNSLQVRNPKISILHTNQPLIPTGESGPPEDSHDDTYTVPKAAVNPETLWKSRPERKSCTKDFHTEAVVAPKNMWKNRPSTVDDTEDRVGMDDQHHEPHKEAVVAPKNMWKNRPKTVDEPEENPEKHFATQAPSSPSYNDLECRICGEQEPADTMLICDKCDQGYHCECTDPPLPAIPEGEWNCADCDDTEECTQRNDITKDNATLHYLQHHEHELDSTPATKKRARKRAERYFIDQNKLYFRATNKFDAREVPSVAERSEIVEALHNFGHFGVQRTANLVQERYYWAGIFSEVTKHVEGCIHCKVRQITYLTPPVLKSIPINEQAFYRVGIDLIGPITETPTSNKYMLSQSTTLQSGLRSELYPTRNLQQLLNSLSMTS